MFSFYVWVSKYRGNSNQKRPSMKRLYSSLSKHIQCGTNGRHIVSDLFGKHLFFRLKATQIKATTVQFHHGNDLVFPFANLKLCGGSSAERARRHVICVFCDAINETFSVEYVYIRKQETEPLFGEENITLTINLAHD